MNATIETVGTATAVCKSSRLEYQIKIEIGDSGISGAPRSMWR